MAWTAPRTWVAGAVVTAAQLNQHLRDNLLALRGGDIEALDAARLTGTIDAARLPEISMIQRIQRGYVSYTFADADPVGTTHNVTIPNAVNLAKAAFFYNNNTGAQIPTPDLVDGQTIRITKRSGAAPLDSMFTWQIVEFV